MRNHDYHAPPSRNGTGQLMAGCAVVCAMLCALTSSGCIVAAIGGAVGAVMYGDAKQKEAQARKQEAYSTYRVEMEKINTQRQSSGMEPCEIMTIEEWEKGHAVSKE